jgi:hypothetical protein
MILHPPEPAEWSDVQQPVPEDAPLRRHQVRGACGRALGDESPLNVVGTLVAGHRIGLAVEDPIGDEGAGVELGGGSGVVGRDDDLGMNLGETGEFVYLARAGDNPIGKRSIDPCHHTTG